MPDLNICPGCGGPADNGNDITIGQYRLSLIEDMPGKVWIILNDGEGGAFDEHLLEEVIDKFFNEHF